MIKDHVLAEIQGLRQHLTPEEKDRLDFEELRPSQPTYCIYGQATGSCFSDRAIQLIVLCCTASFPYVEAEEDQIHIGSHKASARLEPGECHWTAMEWWIINKPEHNKEILEYIKGNISEINL